jgi:hypothetical protein
MAIRAAATYELVPVAATKVFELSKYPAFEKSTTRLDWGATVNENIPLEAVVAVTPPADTFTPESSAPVESVTTPPTDAVVVASALASNGPPAPPPLPPTCPLAPPPPSIGELPLLPQPAKTIPSMTPILFMRVRYLHW